MIGIGFGVVLGLIGSFIALAGVLSLGQNLTAVPYPKEDAALVESGAFRFVRHPIYSGIILGSLSWGLLTNSLLALLLTLVLFIFFDVKSRREEQWLSEKYAGYAAYQARVRKLIPLIY
jgi:protein-S-isoprenylcysteine O-methyltransferase Ste14